MDIETKQYVPPSPEERHDSLVKAFSDAHSSEEGKAAGTPEQIEESENVLKNVRNNPQWGNDDDFLSRVSAVTELANTDYSAYEKGMDELSSWFVGADKILKASALERERKLEGAIANLNVGGSREGSIAFIKSVSPELQEGAAAKYFEQTIGDGEIPLNGSLQDPYSVYTSLKGTAFGKKFAEMEDARLRKYGYGGFSL